MKHDNVPAWRVMVIGLLHFTFQVILFMLLVVSQSVLIQSSLKRNLRKMGIETLDLFLNFLVVLSVDQNMQASL